MPNNIDELNNNDFFSGAQRDENIDLNALIKGKKEPEKAPAEKELSPLEQMKKNQENQVSGLEVTKEDMQEKKLKNPILNDDRLDEFAERENELDASIEKRKHVVVIKQPANAFENTQLMMELDAVVIHDDGTASIEYKDKEGNPIEPQYIRLRKEDDEAFDSKAITGKDASETSNDTSDTDDASKSSDADKEDEKRNAVVKVLIDKTGLGTDFIFNTEEKAKIEEATEIQLREVEFVDLESVISKKSDKSFQESINEYQLANSKTTICFPASGFRAQMKGLTYGELGDISLAMDSVTFDQYYKRLSIIYNNMINTNIKPFESFEDFLKGFAYVDIPMALYGLFISTNPEVQSIQLRCGDSKCEKAFNWEYSTRSVLRLEKCSEAFLDDMKKIATAPASEYDKVRKESSVMNSKYVKLKKSGFIVELGIISAYEFLYNFIPVIDDDTFKKAFGNDPNEVYKNNVLLLTTVRSVYVPNSDGTYSKAEGYKDILDAIYNIGPEELKYIVAMSSKLTSKYQSYFSFGDVVCPHCGNVTKDLALEMDDLVFQTYQQLLNTEINVENMQGF